MYRIKRHGRFRKAFAHSNYIRPDYSTIWQIAQDVADEFDVSLSEVVNTALFMFMTGDTPDFSKMPDPARLQGRFRTEHAKRRARTRTSRS